MYLSRLKITNFKNIAVADLEFSPKVNCISGNNGMGKTNLLDAIYTLCMAKSYFHVPETFSITHEEQMAALNGTFVTDSGGSEQIALALYGKNNIENKILKRNGKSYRRFSEHIGLFPVVMVSPADSQLINSVGEERRRFIDRLISQTDRTYIEKLQNYNKLLISRNRLLKDEKPQRDLLDALNEQLAQNAGYIHDARTRICKMLSDTVRVYYSKLSGGEDNVNLIYDSQLTGNDFVAILVNSFERDTLYKYTTVGIHKDDILFEITDASSPDKESKSYSFKRCASQGQQKCLLIALKLSQYSIIKQLKGGASPILLLDDIFDKLDSSRVENLLSLVSGESFGEIFITDSNKVRMEGLIKVTGNESKNFSVSRGKITEIK